MQSSSARRFGRLEDAKARLAVAPFANATTRWKENLEVGAWYELPTDPRAFDDLFQPRPSRLAFFLVRPFDRLGPRAAANASIIITVCIWCAFSSWDVDVDVRNVAHDPMGGDPRKHVLPITAVRSPNSILFLFPLRLLTFVVCTTPIDDSVTGKLTSLGTRCMAFVRRCVQCSISAIYAVLHNQKTRPGPMRMGADQLGVFIEWFIPPTRHSI